jgi:hypothetical protein
MRKLSLTFWMLVVLTAALLALGVVSHTPVRHVVQAAPAILAMLVL